MMQMTLFLMYLLVIVLYVTPGISLERSPRSINRFICNKLVSTTIQSLAITTAAITGSRIANAANPITNGEKLEYMPALEGLDYGKVKKKIENT
jgi:hypothetical protein